MPSVPDPSPGPPGPGREHAAHARAMACAAGGFAHDAKNSLNAMALQIALLADKIGSDPGLARTCTGHLEKLRSQIARVDEMVRCFALAADPAPGTAFDAAGLAMDAARLFGHEARRRRLVVEGPAAAGGTWARGDAARAARIWLGLVWRALAESGEGGVVRLSCSAEAGEVVLEVAHQRAGPAEALSWVLERASEGTQALGGRIEVAEADGAVRTALRLPGEAR